MRAGSSGSISAQSASGVRQERALGVRRRRGGASVVVVVGMPEVDRTILSWDRF
ncbi:MAG: hypothetical protein M3154_11915 [Candidatus Eremiobacteraeota bacterium]|nr:hypothetical protein [Candidatus Eremiobacteraeota bacterium]